MFRATILVARLAIGLTATAIAAFLPAHLPDGPTSGAADPPPPNDNFADASEIPGIPFTDTLTDTSSTTEADEFGSACAGIAGSIWYRLTLPQDTFIEVHTFGSSYDTVLSLRRGTELPTHALACNDDYAGGPHSRLLFTARADATYYIKVERTHKPPFNSPSGQLTLHLVAGPVGTTFTVDSPGDGGDTTAGDGACAAGPGGPCTLRAAIEEANAANGRDSIHFNVQPLDGYVISPASNLPDVTEPVIVDATTQPGYAGEPVIEIDGSRVAGEARGLHVTGGSTMIRGLAIYGFRCCSLPLFANGIMLDSVSNDVVANYIGTNASGLAIGNKGNGVFAYGGEHKIGGRDGGAGNVISNNSTNGITMWDGEVLGNRIGTNPRADAPLPNGEHGIEVGAVKVGGVRPGDANIVSGNGKYGIYSRGHAVIQGNFIGTNADLDPIPNGRGGIFLDEDGGTLVGGASSGAGNVIAHNRGHGVIIGDFSRRNIISGNSTFDNTRLGIFVEDDCTSFCGSYPNDISPSHFPTLYSVRRVAGGITVRGINGIGTIEFFANASMDPSGHGEGKRFLGSIEVTSANGEFEATLPTPSECIITATATDEVLGTSSFSKGVIPSQAGVRTVTSVADGGDANICDGVCHDGLTGCTLRAAIEAANATAGRDTIAFRITGPRSIAPRSPLPQLTDPIVIDGTTQPGARRKPGIELDGSFAGKGSGLTLIGGNSVIKGLVINRFGVDGILIQSANNVVQGDFIGTDSSGTVDRGNRWSGVDVGGTNNLIGGRKPAQRNVISGNDGHGIGVLPGQHRIQGNFIGTDFTGNRKVGNSLSGISVCGCNARGPDTGLPVIGGDKRGAGNLISGNGRNGIDGSGTITALGNKIGTNARGIRPLGNAGAGINVYDDGLTGAYLKATANVIAYNAAQGIAAESGFSLRNSIHSNGAEGLTFWSAPPDYVPPVVHNASRSSGRLTITGIAHATPSANLEIELFANEACDPSGYGEGQRLVGSVFVTTDSAGDSSFSITVEAPPRRFGYVSATLTKHLTGPNQTFGFSNCLPMSSP